MKNLQTNIAKFMVTAMFLAVFTGIVRADQDWQPFNQNANFASAEVSSRIDFTGNYEFGNITNGFNNFGNSLFQKEVTVNIFNRGDKSIVIKDYETDKYNDAKAYKLIAEIKPGATVAVKTSSTRSIIAQLAGPSRPPFARIRMSDKNRYFIAENDNKSRDLYRLFEVNN